METFVCEGSNDLGATFTNLDIKVHYGPDDDTAVMATPKGPSYRTGSDVVLRCSSVSSPAAQIQWARNGTLMGREEPELKLENVQPSQSGGYSCWAKNTKTGKNVQSKPLYIRVSQTGLSDGDIAGIVIGSVLAVVALIAILLLVLGFRCQPSKGFYRKTSTETDSP
ncbi:carcinoembryonic antigen-related cell adhesion molecule 8-like [Engraulis encrasicolus]|uniref:carcinoembryonic antigen-related cell adhesion molecule 8-like n=1 Tax=Engraulis encrasicolus TaxID=184585 RepID=UPI002FD50780